MDFISRAGRMLDRAHFLAGVMLVIVLASLTAVVMMAQRNTELNTEMVRMSKQLPVYVVPGAKADIYSPTRDDLLLEAFTQHVVQSFKTYTYKSLPSQLKEIQKFFSPDFLAVDEADKRFETLIEQVTLDQRSSLFVPTKVLPVRKLGTGTSRLSRMEVSMDGDLSYIVAGTVVETVPMRITLTVQQTYVSKTNPFGFWLAAYEEKELGKQK